MSEDQTPAAFAAPDPAELAPLFPGYEIDSLIAAGGMGAVYRALQKSLERSVAIKILPPELSADAAFCTGFEAEAKAMARLNHPNLIGVYDFGAVAGMLYIVMEYVPGQSLFHSSHGIAIDPSEVIRIVTGICNGLAHAHENGIIHRDIKPSNILLDLNANPKIGDFGLARPADYKVQEGEEIFGTPHYTAPEVISAPESVDCRADIFSVGVMIHELLTGRLPAEDPRPASSISRCDPRFDTIIRRATDPNPSHRYSSASEIAHDFHAIATSAGPRVLKTATTVTPRGVRRLPASSSSGGNSGLVFLLIAALASAVGYFIFSKKNQPSPETNPDTHVPAVSQSPVTREPDTGNKHEPPPPVEVAPAIKDSTPAVTPEPEENVTSKIPSVPTEEPPAVMPKFDVPAFFGRARKIMVERATPIIAARNRKLKDNLNRFDEEAKRLTLQIASRMERKKVEDALGDFLKDCEQNQNHIPEDLPSGLEKIEGMEKIHEERLDIQATTYLDARQSLAQLAPIYILGLVKQIERLEGEDDPAAIEAIDAEIAKTRDDKNYFTGLMLGNESDGEKSDANESDDEETE